MDPIQKEFLEAGIDYIQAISTIVVALPTYKLYPNKTFRNYKAIVTRMRRAGMFNSKELYMFTIK
jgi:hypothetical protein